MYTCDRVCGLVLYLFITHVIVFVLRDFCPGFLLVLTECLSGLSTQAQRPLRPKVRAASLCPRALSTTEHASKLSRAHLLCDSSRSYEAMQDSGNGEFGPVRTYHTNERGGDPSAYLRHRAALGKRAGLCGAVSGLNGRQPRANFLVRPWWLISTMLFVTVSSKPICQKLS